MTLDIHTKTMLENWGFLAEIGEWETLEKAVNLYLEENPPLIYPIISRESAIVYPAPLIPSPPKAKNIRS